MSSNEKTWGQDRDSFFLSLCNLTELTSLQLWIKYILVQKKKQKQKERN